MILVINHVGDCLPIINGESLCLVSLPYVGHAKMAQAVFGTSMLDYPGVNPSQSL